jgi:hypothetical protein
MKDGGRQPHGASEAVAGGETSGVHRVTLRLWADSGKVPVAWAGRERRFSSGDIDAMKVPGGKGADRPRLEGLCVRVSGATGQESSLEAQEAELRATATGTVTRVFRDRLVTTFAGCLYGMRSAAARKRLLAESGTSPPGGSR